MSKWVQTIVKLNPARLPRDIHWLLFQTSCTPNYDPILDTLKLLMLISLYAVRYQGPRKRDPFPPMVFDEAQNELDPFWDQNPSLAQFIDPLWIK